MQYILTQEEFDKHKADAARIIGKMADDLQTACTLVARVVTLADDCDCVGIVNPYYTLNDLPLGEWTLTSGDAGATFVVE